MLVASVEIRAVAAVSVVVPVGAVSVFINGGASVLVDASLVCAVLHPFLVGAGSITKDLSALEVIFTSGIGLVVFAEPGVAPVPAFRRVPG